MVMSKSLVIVESPAKAKTIEKYLGAGFEVLASVGHIMDLPKNEIGVELENRTFEPTLVVSPGKEKVVAQLKRAAAHADEILLAPDPDREGEGTPRHAVLATPMLVLMLVMVSVKAEIFAICDRAAIAKPSLTPMPA